MYLRAISIVGAAIWLAAFQSINAGFGGQLFVGAVRDRNSEKALELVAELGPAIINARDSNGDTALIIAAGRRDNNWTGYLLNNGADPNLSNRDGDSPLIAATRIGYLTGAEWLLAKKAKVDHENRMGETALIVAVQQRQPALVKLLLSKGADPDKQDGAAGYSAREYAKRDTRNPELLRLIEANDAARSKKAASATQ